MARATLIALLSTESPSLSPACHTCVDKAAFASALLATLLLQRTSRYVTITQPICSPRKRRARTRAFFANGIDKLHLPWVVEALPIRFQCHSYAAAGWVALFVGVYDIGTPKVQCIARALRAITPLTLVLSFGVVMRMTWNSFEVQIVHRCATFCFCLCLLAGKSG